MSPLVATSSTFHLCAPGIRGPLANSSLALRGELGMCQEQSRRTGGRVALPDDDDAERSLDRCDGVSTRGMGVPRAVVRAASVGSMAVAIAQSDGKTKQRDSYGSRREDLYS